MIRGPCEHRVCFTCVWQRVGACPARTHTNTHVAHVENDDKTETLPHTLCRIYSCWYTHLCACEHAHARARVEAFKRVEKATHSTMGTRIVEHT